jgi:hypothetical protein
MQVNDKIPHMGVINGLLGLCFPRYIGARVIRVDADDVDFVYVSEFGGVEIGELSSEDKMQELMGFTDFGHVLFSALSTEVATSDHLA